jgi:hypothetical protein
LVRYLDEYEIEKRQNLLDKIEAITGSIDNLVYLETAGLEKIAALATLAKKFESNVVAVTKHEAITLDLACSLAIGKIESIKNIDPIRYETEKKSFESCQQKLRNM